MISRPFCQNSNNFSRVKPSNFSRKIKYLLESFWLLKKILLLSVLWFSAASVNAPTSSFKILLILEGLLTSRGFDVYGPGRRRGGRYSGFQLTRMIEGFLGFEIFHSGFWCGRKFWQVFFGVASLSGDFWGYSH